jgi:hypothetical protein
VQTELTQKKCKTIRRVSCRAIALAVAVLNFTGVWPCSGQGDPLQTEIQSFCYTNEPVSHLMCLLAKRSPVPINVVIDDMSDPAVTITMQKATIKAVLADLLLHHPGHKPHEERGTIMVFPDSLFGKETSPLTKKLAEFRVTYTSYQSRIAQGQIKYGCCFYLPENPDLNVGLSPMRLNRKPDCPTFPYVRAFQNRSVLEILTDISKEGGQSFYCYRMDPADVKARNKSIAERHMGPTWWPKPDAPCYAVIWGTDWSGVRPQE